MPTPPTRIPTSSSSRSRARRRSTTPSSSSTTAACPPARTGGDGEEPTDFHSLADFTAETADANPDWQIDLCDEVIGTWRGEQGKAAAMTLVWGRPMVEGGAVVTAELADLAVDQCVLLDGRFTLIAPDDYRGDTLAIKLYDRRSQQLALESLYADDDEEEE